MFLFLHFLIFVTCFAQTLLLSAIREFSVRIIADSISVLPSITIYDILSKR
jgi:hypothetical protein